MLRTLDFIFDLPLFRGMFGGFSNRPIHFSSRSRRRMIWARFISHID